MNRNIFILLMALVLTAGGALYAQSAGSGAHTNPNLPLTGQQPVDEDVDDTGTEITSDTGHMHRDEVRENREMVDETGESANPAAETVAQPNLNEPVGATDPVDTQELNTGATGTTAIGNADSASRDSLDQSGTTGTATGTMNDMEGDLRTGTSTATGAATGTTGLTQDTSDSTGGYMGDTLPATGSDLPAAALLGLLAMAAAFAVRLLRS